MSSPSYLQFAGAFLSFWLRVGLGFVFCACFAKLLRRPQHRFAVWLAFLVSTAAYWAYLVGEAVFGHLPVSSPSANSAVKFVPEAANHWFVPQGWVHTLAEGILAFACFYLGLVALLFLWRGIAHLRLRSLLRLGVPPSAELADLARKLCSDFGVQRCEVMMLPGITSPATVYWWKPRILLPVICEELGASGQVADVFCHELAHIVRRDYLLASIADAICAAVFFHPAAWYARKQMRLQRELACDLSVVEMCPEHRADYADTLARFMRVHMMQPGPSVGIDFSTPGSVLGLRIRSILHEPGKLSRWTTFARVATGSLLLAGFAVTAPAISVLLDVRPDSNGAGATLVAESARPSALPGKRAAKHSAAHSGVAKASAEPVAYQMPDTMTVQKVHDRVDGPSSGFAGESSDSSDSELAVDNGWKDISTSRPNYRHPTVRGIVIAAVGGVASSVGDDDRTKSSAPSAPAPPAPPTHGKHGTGH